MKVGRNEMCPCGSGRKFKKCCLQTGGVQDLAEFGRGSWQNTYNRLMTDLLGHARSHWGASFMDDAWDEFSLGFEDLLGDFEFENLMTSLFTGWLLYCLSIDEDDATFKEHCPREQTLAESYLAMTKKLKSEEKEALRAANRVPLSYFEVLAHRGPSTIIVKDLMLGQERKVYLPVSPEYFEIGWIFFGALSREIDESSYFLGVGPVDFPFEERSRILEIGTEFAEIFECQDITEEILSQKTNFMLETYFDLIADSEESSPPHVLLNSEGHEMCISRLHFALHCSVDEAAQKLTDLAQDAPEELRAASVPVEGEGDLGEGDGRVIHWSTLSTKDSGPFKGKAIQKSVIRLEHGRLILEVNSKERGDGGRAEIERRLGDKVEFRFLE